LFFKTTSTGDEQHFEGKIEVWEVHPLSFNGKNKAQLATMNFFVALILAVAKRHLFVTRRNKNSSC
jgi:hypothetical protein